jgi:hypothetical protein
MKLAGALGGLVMASCQWFGHNNLPVGDPCSSSDPATCKAPLVCVATSAFVCRCAEDAGCKRSGGADCDAGRPVVDGECTASCSTERDCPNFQEGVQDQRDRCELETGRVDGGVCVRNIPAN